MSHFYLDASAVVKRYSPKAGSAWGKAQIAPLADHTIILSEITLAEVAAALAAKHRASGGITRKECDDAVALFIPTGEHAAGAGERAGKCINPKVHTEGSG